MVILYIGKVAIGKMNVSKIIEQVLGNGAIHGDSKEYKV